MASVNKRVKGHCEDHNFDDYCVVSEHVKAFVASHLNEPVKGIELYKEFYSKEKIKTVNVALVICLNMDIDPPDVQKIPPFSRVEAWVDPSDAGYRVVELIGKNLQTQYERWQPKACYRQCLDPNLEEVKKICINLRRNARTDRILFHYNGHGVPRPTENGEIWVFNRTFTKYIPLSLFDLQRWLGAPSVYVIDCQNAGRVLRMYECFCQRRQIEMSNAPDGGGAMPAESLQHESVPGSFAHVYPQHSGIQPNTPIVSMDNTIMLCACQENEDLPQLAELPADLFTACLTTPIRTALKWHWLKYNKYFPGYIDEELLDRIPGTPGNRMSLLGEINWIFTAVTDTIAWCSFPPELFQKLFRQDLLVASIYRNYLLAERLMRAFGCHPCSWPKLKPTHNHHIWKAWDHSLDLLFHYLPQVLRDVEASPHTELHLPILVNNEDSTENCAAPANAATDTSPDLFQLTAANAQRLTAMLEQVEKQLLHRRKKRLDAPPPGYDEPAPPTSSARPASSHKSRQLSGPSGVSTTESHAKSTQSTATNRTASSDKHHQLKFVIEPSVEARTGWDLSRISEEKSGELPPSASAQSRSCPQLCNSGRKPPHATSDAVQAEDAQNHVCERCDSEEMEFSSSDIDDTEEEEEEDEEEEEEGDDHSPPPPPQNDPHVESNKQGPAGDPAATLAAAVALITAKNEFNLHQPPLASTPIQQQQPQTSLAAQQEPPPNRPQMTSARTVRSGLFAVAGSPSTLYSSASSSYFPRYAPLKQVNVELPPYQPHTPLVIAVDAATPDYRPSSFFTSQMTAFQACLRQTPTNCEKYQQRQTATLLPILLQILLSQTHRVRALQLLSEFLDLGAWAASHCITVGILPYIVRLFNSNVAEVKPHLVFIWGKIISAAQIDFSRHEGIRESGYKYFVNCLRDSSSLSPLVRTIAAFALAKMLVRCDGGGVPDPVFQQAYYTSKPVSFIKIAADELLNATPDCHHLKIWLLLALGRLWFRCDEARWHAVQSEVNIIDDVLFRFLGDPSPGVRAAAVFALGNLIDNYSSEPGLIHEAEILNREVGVRLVEKTLDPSPLVRCELVVALCGFVYQYESRLVEQAYYHYQDVLQMLRTQPSPPLAQEASSAHAQGSPVAAAQFGSPSGATSLWRGVAEFGISRFNLIRSRSQRDLRRAGNGLALSQHQTDSLGVYEVSVFVQDDSPTASKSIFAQLWDTIVTLASDPHPSVAKLANIILVYIIQKLIRKYDLGKEIALCDGRLRPCEHTNEENPVGTRNQQVDGACAAPRTGPRTLSHQPQASASMAEPSVPTGRRRHFAGTANSFQPRVHDENSQESDDQGDVMEVEGLVGLEHVRTEFFDWCSQWFSHPLLHKFPAALQLLQSGGSSKVNKKSVQSPDAHPRHDLTPQCIADLSAISTDPRAHSFSNHLSRFAKHMASRSEGRQRWHAIALRQALASKPHKPSASTAAASENAAAFLAARGVSPLSSRRRDHVHTTSATAEPCSDSVVYRVPLSGHQADLGGLQLLHVFESGQEQAPPVLAKFHPYKPHLLVADEGEGHSLTLWGVHRAERVQRITLDNVEQKPDARQMADELAFEMKQQRAAIGGSASCQITGLEVINSLEERSLVLTASRDGCIRVWQDYDGKRGMRPTLLTAWVGFESLLPLTTKSSGSSGLVTNWSDCSSHNLLLVSGDVRVVRLFDLDQEACIRDLSTNADVPVTRLARADDNLLAAGFADGTVKIFDARLPNSPMSVVFKDTGLMEAGDGGRILDLSFAPYQANRRLYAVSSSGHVGAWHLAHAASASPSNVWQPIVTLPNDSDADKPRFHMKSAILQVSLPCTRSHLVAYGMPRKLYVSRLFDGKIIAAYQPVDDILPTCAAFHPYEPLIALGMSDSSVHLLKFRLPSETSGA